MTVAFQAYTAADKSYLWETYVEAMRPHIQMMWGWDLAWQKNDFEQRLMEYDTSILRVSGERVGYVQVKYHPESTFISMIILEPLHQSKGLGPKILQKLQSVQPGKPLTLRCFQVNKAAYAFYLRSGFEVSDEDDYFISMQRHADYG